jgi:hypothetical protein
MTARSVSLLLLIALLGAFAGASAANMNAWLDRTRIAEGETLQLTLEAPGQVSGRPDTAPLEQDFEVLGISTGSRMSIVNGRTDARTIWALTLSPRRSGRLTVPPLRVANYQSGPLTLQVSDAPAPDLSADILLETDLAPDAPYVQGQVLYTIRLLHAVPLSGGQLAKPEPANTLVQRLGEDREYATTRNGRRYQVIERRYALFPQISGVLRLSAPLFDAEIPDLRAGRGSPFKGLFGNDPFFGRDPFNDLLTPTRRVRVRGEPAELDVQPRPEGVQAAHWLPAERLALQGQWQPDVNDIRVGEPVTLVLKLQVDGLTGGQLPSLAPDAVAGFNVYPDQAQRQTDVRDSGVTGHLEQKIAFLPERAGELALPAIDVVWWDTQTDERRVATLPGRILEVSPAPVQPTPAMTGQVSALPASDRVPDQAAAAASAPNTSVQNSPPSGVSIAGPWPWISAALAIGWSLSMLYGWRRVQASRSSVSEERPSSIARAAATARKQFLAACQAGDAALARLTLLAWAAAHWPSDPPRGLEALSQRLDDPQARDALDELNRVLYREPGPWNGARLARHLQRLPKQGAVADQTEALLPPLYPAYARAQR